MRRISCTFPSFRSSWISHAGLAAMPTRAIGWNKRLFDHATTATLDEQLELEAQLQAAAAQTGDFAEGVAAFLEKRAPSFKGA